MLTGDIRTYIVLAVIYAYILLSSSSPAYIVHYDMYRYIYYRRMIDVIIYYPCPIFSDQRILLVYYNKHNNIFHTAYYSTAVSRKTHRRSRLRNLKNNKRSVYTNCHNVRVRGLFDACSKMV